jgi:uncharacterized membrane protein YvbJ
MSDYKEKDMNTAYCVHCGKQVSEFAVECPFCKKPVANPHAPTKMSPEPKTWKKTSYAKKAPVGILIACLAAIIIAAVVLYIVKFSG